jgi:hypothetical protein
MGRPNMVPGPDDPLFGDCAHSSWERSQNGAYNWCAEGCGYGWPGTSRTPARAEFNRRNACPKCGRAKGRPCRSPRGSSMAIEHQVRQDLAAGLDIASRRYRRTKGDR